MNIAAAGQVQADALHGRLEQITILGLLDGRQLGSDEFHVVAVENTGFGQVNGQIQAGLTAYGRQQGVRAFPFNNFFKHRPGQRLNIGPVGKIGIGHNRGRIRVDQDDAVALLFERLAGLSARVIKFTRLADHNRAGTDQQNGMKVCTLGHDWSLLLGNQPRHCSISAVKRRNK